MTPRFCPGDAVRTRASNPPGHTRLPGYLCGKKGRIVCVIGVLPFADARARGNPGVREVAYTVTFDAQAVWGPGTPSRATIAADLFESYLLADQ